MVQITEKQREYLLSKQARVNLLEGSVRSGKTWISLVMWALFVASMPKDAEFLMVGKTLTTLRRNCLNLLREMEPTFKFSTTGKSASLYGHRIWLEGADNEASENKIRGMTLAGAYFDELTLIPRGFYYMALSRLSYPGAKLFATTNPDTPTNYVYTDIIQNEAISKTVTKFLIRDNTFLEQEYIEELEREYEAVPNAYQRYILGEWVLAEGLVYRFKDEYVVKDEDISSAPGEYYVSIDYGTQNPFSAGLWLLQGDKATRVDEYYYGGRQTNIQKTEEEYCDEVEKWCAGKNIRQVIVDPSAASFIAALRKRGFKVMQGNNEVLDGIRRVAVYLAGGNIRIHERCKASIAEFGLYRWDDKAVGVDRVVKENDHAMDDIRYFANTILKHKVRKNSYLPIW